MKSERQPLTNGLASCGVSARGKFCGNLKVLSPVRDFAFPRPNAKPPTVVRQLADKAATFREYRQKMNILKK